MERYPRHINVNFRKLDKVALTRMLKYYNVEYKENAPQSELAILAAKVFDTLPVVENDVLDRVAQHFLYAAADTPVNGASKKRSFHTSEPSILASDQEFERGPAVPGEQVAAKVSKSDDWILGNILDFDPRNQTYLVQDEDDVNRIMTLPFGDVRRLEETASTHLRRGDSVLAVFPETTSFYKAVVAKTPKFLNGAGGGYAGSQEIIIKFEDDEDESGKNPARRVPARFVLLRRDLEDVEDSEDDDV